MNQTFTVAKAGQATTVGEIAAKIAEARAAGATDDTPVDVYEDPTLMGQVCATLRLPVDVEGMSGPELLKELRQGHPDNGPAVWAEIERRLCPPPPPAEPTAPETTTPEPTPEPAPAEEPAPATEPAPAEPVEP